jgi:pyruvate, water dikinase
MSTTEAHRFVSPYDDPAPDGAEGWEELYPYYLRFRADRREFEESRFWFADLQHWPTVFKPFDTITVEFAIKCLGQYNTRHLLIPPANGIDYRVHNGYVYMSPVPVPEDEIAARVPQFTERAGHYFANWTSLLENWEAKVRRVIADLEALEFEPLPEVVPIEWIKEGVGLDNTFALAANYDRAIELCYEAFQYHFEFLNLGYVAYLDFFTFCKEVLPGVADLGIAKMVQGIDVVLFRPDEELRKLARLAMDLGIEETLASAFGDGAGDVDGALAAVAAAPRGAEWIAAWEAAQEPWFNFSSGNGMYSTDRVWLDHLEIPLGFIRDYVGRLAAGEEIERPTEQIRAERDRITAEYRELLPDDEARAVFDEKLGLSRLVFPYVEDHNFYIEHWSLSIFWRKIRRLGQVLADAGFWTEADDIFYVRRDELQQVIFDYGNGWGIGVEPMGPYYWPAEIARRKKIIAALELKAPAPAMNEPPAVVTEPFTIMLYGITSEAVSGWLSAGADIGHLAGMAASPGRVEGIARVVGGAEDLHQVQEGEVLVTRITAPSWGPVFGRIAATVTDIGGMMSHAAIVCREYGLPAVTGVGSATTAIRTGQRVRVDGNTGTVTILDE